MFLIFDTVCLCGDITNALRQIKKCQLPAAELGCSLNKDCRKGQWIEQTVYPACKDKHNDHLTVLTGAFGRLQGQGEIERERTQAGEFSLIEQFGCIDGSTPQLTRRDSSAHPLCPATRHNISRPFWRKNTPQFSQLQQKGELC